ATWPAVTAPARTACAITAAVADGESGSLTACSWCEDGCRLGIVRQRKGLDERGERRDPAHVLDHARQMLGRDCQTGRRRRRGNEPDAHQPPPPFSPHQGSQISPPSSPVPTAIFADQRPASPPPPRRGYKCNHDTLPATRK